VRVKEPEKAVETENIQYDKTPINKLGRGLINTGTFWAEVPAQAFKVTNERDPLMGATLGVAEGLFTGLLRGLSGIYDTLTFILPPYDKPMMKPDYALKNADDRIKEYLW
jgi:putative exosortase-associated protein (TIGR04073 family)